MNAENYEWMKSYADSFVKAIRSSRIAYEKVAVGGPYYDHEELSRKLDAVHNEREEAFGIIDSLSVMELEELYVELTSEITGNMVDTDVWTAASIVASRIEEKKGKVPDFEPGERVVEPVDENSGVMSDEEVRRYLESGSI